jgi:L-Ala-D/L-Glu epimerase
VIISRVTVYSYALRLSRPFVTALGPTVRKREIVVSIETDDGLIGWGEASPNARILSSTSGTIRAALDVLAPAVLGEDPRRIERIGECMEQALHGNPPAKAALDMALHDLLGRHFGEPVWRLLGGERATPLDTDRTVSLGSPEAMVAEARELVADGAEALKVKVGRAPRIDVDALRSIRDAVGDGVALRIDANQGWNRVDALYALERMVELDLQFVEQPLAAWDLEGLAGLRRRTPIPVMADEAVFSPEDALRAIRADAVDYINIKLMKSGGLVNACRIADLAQAGGVACMVGGMVETNLSATAAVHFAMAKRNVTFRDLDMGLLGEAALVTRGGSVFEGARHHVSPAPGLGIEALDLPGLGRPVAIYGLADEKEVRTGEQRVDNA